MGSAGHGGDSSSQNDKHYHDKGRSFSPQFQEPRCKPGLFCFVRKLVRDPASACPPCAQPLSSLRQIMPNPSPPEPPPRSWPWRPLLPPLLAAAICIIIGVSALWTLGFPPSKVIP